MEDNQGLWQIDVIEELEPKTAPSGLAALD